MLAEALSLTAAQMLDLLPWFALGAVALAMTCVLVFWVPAYRDHRRAKRAKAEEYRRAYEALILKRDRVGL